MSVQAKRWTREEYDRLVELGVLTPESRVQLIEGEILQMAPQGAPHASTIGIVQEALQAAFGGAAYHLRCQLPLVIGNDSEPEPDFAVVRGRPRDYARRHPAAADTALVVEIAGSTIELDRRRKATLYGSAGIPEYWILSVDERILEVFTRPGPSGYADRLVLKAGDTARPAARPDSPIDVASLLP